jgi:hypothetical protein
MAVRIPPVLPLPPQFAEGITAAMTAAALQHQDELTAFLSWTQTLSPRATFDTIVEIGSHRGALLELWCRLATRGCVAIDLPDGVGGGLSAADMRVRDERLQARFPHFVGIRGDSHDPATADRLEAVLHGCGSAGVDLLFIDGDHIRAGVQADYDDYAPFVRSGGIIAFHDVTCTPERAQADRVDVRPVFDALPAPRFLFSVYGDWGGIGAVVVP